MYYWRDTGENNKEENWKGSDGEGERSEETRQNSEKGRETVENWTKEGTEDRKDNQKEKEEYKDTPSKANERKTLSKASMEITEFTTLEFSSVSVESDDVICDASECTSERSIG